MDKDGCTEMGDFFQDRPGYLARADLQKCSGSHKSVAFICHCFLSWLYSYCVNEQCISKLMEIKRVGYKNYLVFKMGCFS